MKHGILRQFRIQGLGKEGYWAGVSWSKKRPTGFCKASGF